MLGIPANTEWAVEEEKGTRNFLLLLLLFKLFPYELAPTPQPSTLGRGGDLSPFPANSLTAGQCPERTGDTVKTDLPTTPQHTHIWLAASKPRGWH